jgi:hypothetical protein
MIGRKIYPPYDPAPASGVIGRVRNSWGPKGSLTEVSVGFLEDRFCSAADTIEDDQCKEGSETSPAHFVVTHGAKQEAHIATLPPRCSPTIIGSPAGLPFVLCNSDGRIEILVFDGKTLVSELVTKTPATSFYAGYVAADGTLAIRGRCHEKGCSVSPGFVRKPVAVGAEKPWRELSHDSGVAHRLLTGGRVLAMVVEYETEEDAKVSFVIDHPDGQRTTLVQGVHLRGHLAELLVRDDGQIQIRLGTERLDPLHGDFVIVDDGSLLSPN